MATADPYAAVHAAAVTALQSWVPPDAGQEVLRADFLQVLREHPDGIARSGPPAHLTASCLVLDESGEHVLLTHHRKANAWFQFGGHIDPTDASLWAAARREATEESGLAVEPATMIAQLDRHTLQGDFGRCREHLDVRFAAVLPRRASPVVSAESHAVRWFHGEELPARSGEELAELIAAGRRLLGLAV